MTIFVEEKNKKGELFNIYLKDKLNDNQSQVIYAKKEKLVFVNNKNYLILNNGKFIDIDKKN